jgi:hypothetical protein
VDKHVADWLGVGNNMAKSIKHWLVATGLAELLDSKNYRKNPGLRISTFGELIVKEDPYFTLDGTWWALHVNLVNNRESAASWNWFFNYFNLNRFDKAVCLDSLRRYLQMSDIRMPTQKTLERDVGCLLSSYSKKIPAETIDPEEALDCPFYELGLMNYFRNSGSYQLHQGPKGIPAHIFGYAISKALLTAGRGFTENTITELTRLPGGPGRAFVLTSETLYETAVKAERDLMDNIQISGLAGERVIRVKKMEAHRWMKEYYSAVKRKERHVA